MFDTWRESSLTEPSNDPTPDEIRLQEQKLWGIKIRNNTLSINFACAPPERCNLLVGQEHYSVPKVVVL